MPPKYTEVIKNQNQLTKSVAKNVRTKSETLLRNKIASNLLWSKRN